MTLCGCGCCCGCASSLSNTCKNAWSINPAFKNTMFFNELPPKQQFCCGVMTHTCPNRSKYTVFTRICKTAGPVASKHSVFTMNLACQKYPVLSLFLCVRKSQYFPMILYNISPISGQMTNKHTFLQRFIRASEPSQKCI